MKKDIVINKAFSWNGSDWKIGSVEFDENYRSSAVLHLCRRIPAAALTEYHKKIEPVLPFFEKLNYEQAEIIRSISPFQTDFSIELMIDGKSLAGTGCAYRYWEPKKTEYDEMDREVYKYIKEFHLDENDGWMIASFDLNLTDHAESDLSKAYLKLSQDSRTVYGDSFAVSQAGQAFLLINPVTKTPHVLEIKEFSTEQLDSRFSQDEEPLYCANMEYEIIPPLSEDSYKLIDIGPDLPENSPSLMFYGELATCPGRAVRRAWSNLRKEPIDYIVWRMEFIQKDGETVTVSLA